MRYVPRRRRLRRRGVVNVALAAFVATGLVAGVRLALRGTAPGAVSAAQQNAALTALATSGFRSVAFDAESSDAPQATALYARDGRWLYVVVARPRCGCRVVDASGGASRELGKPEAVGTVSTLYVAAASKPAVLLLERGQTTVATATLAY